MSTRDQPAPRFVQIWQACVGISMWGLVAICVSHCGMSATPQLLPWSEQLQQLQAQAVQHDAEALLHTCIVSEPGSYSETLTVAADEPLLLGCRFIRPDGTTFRLRYDDLHMSATLARDQGSGHITGFDQTALRTLQRAQGAPQIGPREALMAAQPYSEAFQERVGPIASSSAILRLGDLSMERTKLPAMWSITHYSFSKETEQIWVSALDGTVIEREEEAAE
ncbi:MAG: hypothetical protein GFH24_608350n113 [Chloroflexi bacterium AL-N5]|nr:hypothetical protein [Chloroflexi bacterium AL-N5]